MKKKLHSRKVLKHITRLIGTIAIALLITGTYSASAKTTKIFKAVSQEKEERSNVKTSSAETKTSQQNADDSSGQEDAPDEPKKNTNKKNNLKKASNEGTPNPSKAEDENQVLKSEIQEPVYEVLTDIRCILLGILMISGLITGIVLSHSFQRGIKK